MNDFERNRAGWDAHSDEYQAMHREQLERVPKGWGVWSIPESDLRILGDVRERDVLEYGCGAAAWSIALAREGARVVALDNSSKQLEHAHRAIEAAAVDIALVHAVAEETPFANDAFDIVFCDHGAMSFVDPARTIPEVARILRPGGLFAFDLEHPIHAMAWSEDGKTLERALVRSYFKLGRYEDRDDGIVSYSRTISGYVSLLMENGFAIERLLELAPPEHAESTYGEFAPIAWAHDFPVELLIAARLVSK